MYFRVAITVAVQRLRENRVCSDLTHLFIDVLAKVGHVEDATPILEARISQVFSQIFNDRAEGTQSPSYGYGLRRSVQRGSH